MEAKRTNHLNSKPSVSQQNYLLEISRLLEDKSECAENPTMTSTNDLETSEGLFMKAGYFLQTFSCYVRWHEFDRKATATDTRQANAIYP
jgi:hypothetical protein